MEVSKTLSGLAQRLNLLNIQLVAGSCGINRRFM
jgi:hypothetical protein